MAASARHHFAFCEVTRSAGDMVSDDKNDDNCMRDSAFVELLHKWGVRVMQPSSTAGAAHVASSATAAQRTPRWLLRRFRYTVLADAPSPPLALPWAVATAAASSDVASCSAHEHSVADTASSAAAPTAPAAALLHGASTQQQQQQPSLSSQAHTLPLPFHDGLAHSLLACFFESAVVQALLGVTPEAHHESTRSSSSSSRKDSQTAAAAAVQTATEQQQQRTCVTAVHYTPLRVNWTTLTPLRRLVEANVVRCTQPYNDDNTANTDNSNTQAEDDAVRMPIVKRPEMLLPGDVVVADALRALFLVAHSRPCHCLRNNDDKNSDEDVSDDDAWGEAYDDYGYNDSDDDSSSSSCTVHSLRRLRRLFAREERNELLYHVVWRLVAGGGAMNQFEDDWRVYARAARTLLRTLVAGSVTAVPAVTDTTTSATTAATAAAVVRADDGKDAATGHSVTVTTRTYTAQLRCYAYAVHSIDAPYALFASSDGVVPSNVNYCYVIVHPAQHEVVLWYNGC